MSTRNALPQRRAAETFDLRFGNLDTTFAVTVGYYDDGRIGEVFISGAKSGRDVEAIARDGAVLLSIALQHGVAIETVQRAITRDRDGKPSTVVGAVIDKLGEPAA